MRFWYLLIMLFAMPAAGCSSSGENPDGTDAGLDAWDAQDDHDAGDPGGDDSPDAGVDAAEAADSGPGPCPGPEAYQGEDWPGVLEVPVDRCFLAASIEGSALEQMFQTQAIMRLPTGSYPVPLEEGNYSMRLPVCFQWTDPGPPFALGEAGELTVQRYGESVYLNLWQDIHDQAGEPWSLHVYMSGEGSSVIVDGAYLPGLDYEHSYNLVSNDFAYYDRWRHNVSFQGGNLSSDFFAAWGGTPSSGLLLGGYGTLDGVEFEQYGYWKVVNNHKHHFFGADWALLFDSPIGDACGIRIDEANPIGRMQMYDGILIHTVDCDLQYLEERALVEQDAVEFALEQCPCPDFHP